MAVFSVRASTVQKALANFVYCGACTIGLINTMININTVKDTTNLLSNRKGKNPDLNGVDSKEVDGLLL